MAYPRGDRVAAFISDYLSAIEAGRERPHLDALPPPERDEVRELLADINTDPDFEVDIPPLSLNPPTGLWDRRLGPVGRWAGACVRAGAFWGVRDWSAGLVRVGGGWGGAALAPGAQRRVR